MLSTGEIIKVLLDEKGMHTKDLARITGLKEAAVLNVLYNRSTRAEYLNRIAKALDVPLDTLLKAKKTYTIEVKTYANAAKIVFLQLEKLGINQLPSRTLIEYIDSTYENLAQTGNEEGATMYISGMISGHIKFGILKKT